MQNPIAAAGASSIPVQHLNQDELAGRWNISPRTLERWRWLKRGPAFIKVEGSVRYRIEDVEAYEAQQLRQTRQNAILGAWR